MKSDERYKQIVALRNAGLPTKEIAARLNITHITVRNHLTGRIGVSLNDYGLDRRRKLTGSQIEELIRRKAAGERIKDIAAHFGISNTCVEYYTLPGYAESVNQASAERRKRLLKTDKACRERNNERQLEHNARRTRILNEILRNEEITK